jgi:hypothetical protein
MNTALWRLIHGESMVVCDYNMGGMGTIYSMWCVAVPLVMVR